MTDGRATAYSEHEREFTFAKNGLPYAIGPSSVCPVLYVCNVGALWPNGWMDEGETWHR